MKKRCCLKKIIMIVIVLSPITIITNCVTIYDYWEKGQIAAKNNNYQEAILQYTKAIRASKDIWELAESYELRGKIYAILGEYDKAITDFSEIIILGRNNGYLERGKIFFILENYEEAIGNFSQYINIEKSDPLGYINRGDVYIALGDNIKALNDYNEAIKICNSILLNNPVMNDIFYEKWKITVQNYIKNFKEMPYMNNQAILIVKRSILGDISVLSFGNNAVFWNNCIVSIPSGRNSLKIRYSYEYKETIIQRAPIPIITPGETGEGYETTLISIGSVQIESTYLNRSSFEHEFQRLNFLPGRIYKIELSDFRVNFTPRRMDVIDITQKEGIQLN